ncbi:hypothetical protein F2P81_025400 [Scophthalmus maximus]|uniref:Retinoblastoma-like protein 1 n=1 Tax=Scophthalmus maximus TaxID=52904 RepID=A0A6A4RQ87_SCOMX|nr:hypothetical protein F2P81_025400 [Scophthalmus maximus]
MRGEESSDSESGRMEESSVRRSLETLCQELNMDEQTAAAAMDNFTAIWNTYTLEGDVVHWLACSLYAACRKGSVPTVGKGLMEGNCVSLTRILRSSKLSLIQFFSKMRKWSDMSNLSQHFRLRMEQLERNFEVSTVIFRKFEPIFMDIRLPCHIGDVFKFCWTLFVYTKGIEEQNQNVFADILRGSEELLTEMLDPQNFIDNNKAINREYEEYVLTVGDFDERVFLGADADEEIGTPRKTVPEPSAGLATTRHQLQQHSGSLAPSTPLTGRVYLKEKDLLVTPVSSATQTVSRLQSMVAGSRAAPSDHLTQIFKFFRDFRGGIKYTCGSFVFSDFAENRLKLAEILYYKILENVMAQETKRLQGKDMSVLLEQDIFHCSLMACCLEVVLFAYSSQRTFPWIISVVKLPPFYFFKVNFSSSLDTGSVPGSGSAPGSASGAQSHLPLVALSPIIHPRIREFRSGLGSARKDVPPSPLSVHDRYSSPAAGSAKRRLFGDDPPLATSTLIPSVSQLSSPAKRLTFGSTGTLKIGGQTTILSIPLQGLNNERTITLIPVQPCDSSGAVTAQFLLTASPSRVAAPAQAPAPAPSDPQAVHGRPRRTGSLALFFRKAYHLASVRLRDLCVKLDVSSDLRGKIWTCFEHALVHCTDLMKDRHLDQLLLCSIYIISKITKETHTFQDIMKCYRSQPQASSHVYRSVLLRHGDAREPVADENMEVDPVSGGESAEKTNQVSGEADSNQPGDEERGDLIQFYNAVFVLKMKSFALRYATHDNRADAPPLSPFPTVRAQPLSPRRVSQRHSLYVSPHKNSAGCLTPNSYTYRINSSPSKELSDINRMIRLGCVSRKRAFTMEGDVMMSSAAVACDSPSKKACPENSSSSSPDVLLKRLQDVVSERQSR